ncbi:unnamed protein product [Hymenolepis diminuta]|uniref:Uncharacterized protein n=1 Tax=Hymenolepis diminuta TaxID=6216 RepID=A0A564Y0L3_HYMDI|nr:unnamed protein product [Hymenolepis diminuta]
MNEVDIIAPSERFLVFEGGSMKKRVAYHFQNVPEQQTAEGSAASVKTHPPSFLPRRKPNYHSNPPTPNRWWNNPLRGNNMSRHLQRWPYQ